MKASKSKPRKPAASENPASIQPAVAELDRAFRSLVSRFAGLGARPYPRILIQSRGRKRHVLGWFSRERWRNGQADAPAIHEISIAAESLSMPITEIMVTLVHEMVHLACYYADIQDVGKDGRYHNQKFKVAAEAAGLIVEKDLRIGWSKTRLGPELETFISSLNVNPEAFAMFRLGEPEREKQETKGKKWICGCNNIRAATKIRPHCTLCDNMYVRADSGEQPYPYQPTAPLPTGSRAVADVMMSAVESILKGEIDEAVQTLIMELYARGRLTDQDLPQFRELQRATKDKKEEPLLSEEVPLTQLRYRYQPMAKAVAARN